MRQRRCGRDWRSGGSNEALSCLVLPLPGLCHVRLAALRCEPSARWAKLDNRVEGSEAKANQIQPRTGCHYPLD